MVVQAAARLDTPLEHTPSRQSAVRAVVTSCVLSPHPGGLASYWVKRKNISSIYVCGIELRQEELER